MAAAVLLAASAAGSIATLHFMRAGAQTPPSIVVGAAEALDLDSKHGRTPAGPARRCSVPTLIGTASTRIVARTAPRRSARPVVALPRRNVVGAPQTLDLLETVFTARHGTWYRALLPLRPNGTTGYVPATALRVTTTDYRLTISRRHFRLILWKGCRRLDSFPIGVGTGLTPTPVGRFYIIALLKPPDPDTIYGSYAYGLSAFSDVLTDWKGGGIIGLHGTNIPSSIGRRSSHGCIRMRNRDIEPLVKLLPLGTPVTIT